MNMNKLRACIVVLIGIAAAHTTAQNVDQKILGIETGMVYGYDVGSGNLGNASAVGLHFTLTDNLAAGFSFLSGDGTGLPATAGLLSLNYGFAERFGINVSLGRSTVPLTGIGLWVNLFERKLQDTIATALKLRVDYLFAPSVGMDAGDLCVGLSVLIGL